MKKSRVICLVIVLVMAAMAFLGCAQQVDWSNVPKATVIADVNGYEIDMDLVKYFYAEQVAADEIGAALAGTTANFFGDAALTEQKEDVAYENCINAVLFYAALDRIAEEKGLAEDYDTSREKAYSELILSAKNNTSGYEYFSQYTQKIKSNYTATDEVLCDIAGEMYMLRNSAENLIDDYYDNGSYESKDEAKKDIISKLEEEMKDMDIKFIYPDERDANIEMDNIVESFLTLK